VTIKRVEGEVMVPDFKRIAVVNRGESAMRLVRAVKELHGAGQDELRTIALYTEPDAKALFVREADEAYCLGAATFVDSRDGIRKNRYLDYAALESALRESRAEAVWVGWGFVAEHVGFAELCRDLGIVFIGPEPEVMRKLGDKIGSKRLAEDAGVPVAPWSGGAVHSLQEAENQAAALGLPLMIKATAGGGGRGIRRVGSLAELHEAYESARSEALKGFGDDTVFMETMIEGARHIEVQIIGDNYGKVWALGVRDCSVQRRNQKVIEESPSPVLTVEQHRDICDAARRLGELSGYGNAGTVEFLYDPLTERFSFMEVNARLQVEHPVTEIITGADLVKLQIHVARGGRLEGEEPAPRGHAIEVRVNAEDPERSFAPAPGEIVLFHQPGGTGVRIDTGFVEGDQIAPEFDSMLAKVIGYGADREEAMARLTRALREMRLAIRGGTSNKGFLISLLERDEVRASRYDIGWLDRLAVDNSHLSQLHAEVAILHAAMEAYLAEFAIEKAQFYAVAARGRLKIRQEIGYEVELRHRGTTYRCRVLRVGPRHFRVSVDGCTFDIRMERVGQLEYHLNIAGRQYKVLSQLEGNEHLVEINGIPHRLSRDDAGVIRAPAPAVLLSYEVQPGQVVDQGQRLAVLEAMKTELPVTAPCSGRVGELLVGVNVQVDAGAPLLEVEPLEESPEELEAQRIGFSHLAGVERGPMSDERRCRDNLEEMHRLVLGFDVEASQTESFVKEHAVLCAIPACDDREFMEREDEILRIFVDVCALFSHRGEGQESSEYDARTPEEYLLLYLRSLDTSTAGVSGGFVDALRRTLSHYGLDSLDRTPELEETLLWISKANQRMNTEAKAVLSILERRIEQIDTLAPLVNTDFRLLLDRLVPVTRRHYPAVSDLAMEVRYRYFYRPFFDEIWNRAQVAADSDLTELVGRPDPARRADVTRRLVEFPYPVFALLMERYARADEDMRQIITEILTLRYYRIRLLREVKSFAINGLLFTRARYELDDLRIELLSVVVSPDQLQNVIETLHALMRESPEEREVAVDIYLTDATTGIVPLRQRVQPLLVSKVFSRPIRRLVFALPNPGHDWKARASEHLIYRQREGRFEEDQLYCGLHPLMGKRMELWRLSNFELERLPSSEGIYLFRGVARENPKDERLFAFAEVRDLTPLFDPNGRISRLPHLEMMVMETLAAIRLFQSHRPTRSRLQWNRVFLYVWPIIEFGAEELNTAAQLLVPVVEDLGLEKIILRGRIRQHDGSTRDVVIEALTPGGREVTLTYSEPAVEPVKPLDEYARKVVSMRRRGMIYPYEIIRTFTPAKGQVSGDFPPGEFIEYDLDDKGILAPVSRPPGRNTSGLIAGIITHFTTKYPEGMSRVLLMGDPTFGMGSLAEPECRRVIAALDLARQLRLPVDWYAISAGALIAMDSGTENLDWTASVLRRLIEFTQDGGVVNLVVSGVNVGAQSYWNAEATMLMHTRGILVMTSEGSMLLTGKRALDYSGAVSADDNQGIGGYERIMGVNGQAQYWAMDVWEACHILLRHYEHTFVIPGERFPRRAPTKDPASRDIGIHPHGHRDGYGFDKVGDIFSDDHNPGRNRPFDIRKVMGAVVDQDGIPLERWKDLREGETAVVWDAHLGGYPVALLGIESHPITRLGFVPTDGPEQWSSGTLFPLSSKKIARAINGASDNRPVVVLANLSGFDGSPESMRRLQLEYGAEIGRAVVNFRGPMVFCGICRYHGGAYVVFSRSLNEGLEVAALEGSYASVIGGKPAAAVVFASDVDRRTRADSRLQELERKIAQAGEAKRGRLRTRWHEIYEMVYSEKLGEVAEQFDSTHSVHRAQQVGSLHHIVEPSGLRPYLIEAVERGIQRELATWSAPGATL
jgi:acetyl/propionyl-CoA carboxylase alpha subunit/acetyl-CoA carboxylase carboxyltransferase component